MCELIKELRIGNYILGNYTDYEDIDDIEKQEVCKVLTLDSVGVAEYSIWVEGESAYIERYDSFEGIPLTEEWLIKFGYKKYPHGDALFLPGHLVWVCNDLFIDDKNGIVLKYVHQIQNLYFALTSKELPTTNL